MGVSVLLQSLASSASFPARPFISVFLVALLIAHHQYPGCATRLPARSPQQPCPARGTVTFADPAAVTTYVSTGRIEDRGLRTANEVLSAGG